MCFFSLFAPFFFFTHLIADWWILGWRWKDSGQRRKSRNRSRRLSVFLAQIAQIGKYTHNVKDDKTRTVTLTQMTADIKRCWNDSVELLFRSFFSLIRVPGWPAVEQIEGLRLRHPVAISVHKRKEGWKKTTVLDARLQENRRSRQTVAAAQANHWPNPGTETGTGTGTICWPHLLALSVHVCAARNYKTGQETEAAAVVIHCEKIRSTERRI